MTCIHVLKPREIASSLTMILLLLPACARLLPLAPGQAETQVPADDADTDPADARDGAWDPLDDPSEDPATEQDSRLDHLEDSASDGDTDINLADVTADGDVGEEDADGDASTDSGMTTEPGIVDCMNGGCGEGEVCCFHPTTTGEPDAFYYECKSACDVEADEFPLVCDDKTDCSSPSESCCISYADIVVNECSDSCSDAFTACLDETQCPEGWYCLPQEDVNFFVYINICCPVSDPNSPQHCR